MSEQPPPAEPQRSPSGAAAQGQPPPEPVERYGIVVVERLVKDDGRSLLLYTQDRQDAR
jgi:hypothetical protein